MLQGIRRRVSTMSTYHDIEQIMQHLSAQNAELLRKAKTLMHLLEKNGISAHLKWLKQAQLEAYIERIPTNAPINPAPTEGEKSGT